MNYTQEPLEHSTLFDQILRAALDLPPDARAMLADLLLESLEDSEKNELDAAWVEEIERRIRDIDEGRVKLIPGEEVMEGLRSRYKR